MKNLVWIRREICTDQTPFYKHKLSKTFLNKCWWILINCFTGGHVIMDYALLYFDQKRWFKSGFNTLIMDLFLTNMHTSKDVKWWTVVVWIIPKFLSAVWALILTAPIRCRRIHWWASHVMLNFCKSVLMKKQINLHHGWPEVELHFS